MSHHVLLSLAQPGFLCLARVLMDSLDREDSYSQSDCECVEDGEVDSWDVRPWPLIITQSPYGRNRSFVEVNMGVLPLSSVSGKNSWQSMSSLKWKSSPSSTPRKPTIWDSDARRLAGPSAPSVASCLPWSCYRHFAPGSPMPWTSLVSSTYSVPQAEDVPLILRNLTAQDIRVLRPLDIHSGEYKRVVHGYCQCNGPFRVSWSSLSVQDKIARLGEPALRAKL